MVVLNNNNKAIQFSVSNTIHENREATGSLRFTYAPELPTIKCSDKRDAEFIQQKVNTFINDLSKNLLK